VHAYRLGTPFLEITLVAEEFIRRFLIHILPRGFHRVRDCGLAKAKENVDAAIHTAFDHDFSNFVANCEKDRRVIAALGSALKGSDRPLLIASGVGIGDPRNSTRENQHHAIFDNDKNAPATALLAYDASVELTGATNGSRVVKLSDFFLPPEMQRDRDTGIEPGEVLTRVTIPPLSAGTKAAYHKQTERESYDWPICDVAVVLTMEGQIVQNASIVMGWVAPTPRRAAESERLLAGKRLTDDLARQAAHAAVADATPLSKNGYKVPVLETVVRRTILAAAAAG
jgi:hypothetical protein